MGKVVKAVAVIAIAAAIAYFAPQLTPAFLTATLGSAAATTLVATALTLAATTAFQALTASKPHTTTAPGRQPSRGQVQEADGFSWRYPALPSVLEFAAVRDPWWRDELFWPWQRFALSRVEGDCMAPVLPLGTKWVVIDRYAPIERGDLFLFRPDDLRHYLRTAGLPRKSAGLVKRFLGVDPERRVIVYETTRPPNRIETGIDRVMHAYRVVSPHETRAEAGAAAKRAEAGGAK